MSSSGIVISPNLRRASMALAVLGLLGLAAGLAQEPTRGFSSLLLNGFFFLTLALGGAVFLALNSVANAGWYTVFKRIPEAFASYVPVGAVSLLVVLAGLPSLYLWARPGVMETDHLLHQKAAFLNAPGFAIRMGVMLVLWAFLTWRLRKNSLDQDAEPSVGPTKRNVATSAIFLVVFAISFCLASFDWLMSLEPHWFSTIYGLYNVAGLLESSVAAITVAVVLMKRSGLMKELNTSHLHDLGKLMFGFATLWAYLWFSQFLLIWYANIPEETVYFIHRMHGGWEGPFYLNVVLNWALPFVLLLPKPAKRNATHLCLVAGIMLAGRWLDLHLMIAPSNMPEYTGISVWDVAGLVGLGALFVLTVTRTVASVPLIARNDPYLVESLHHHT
ncbi:hypothetical protein JRI60_37520 [Archangium violaceum]|uniref:hypothetical protein n=1 Tax=Archangium violaceum TaxID=83451 RepID=UPI00194E6854|nr:hypothetical protein [Archangium violaceum]QRN94773.1 hypothetical protein JRI60_37520 [Archangium violaceum]